MCDVVCGDQDQHSRKDVASVNLDYAAVLDQEKSWHRDRYGYLEKSPYHNTQADCIQIGHYNSINLMYLNKSHPWNWSSIWCVQQLDYLGRFLFLMLGSLWSAPGKQRMSCFTSSESKPKKRGPLTLLVFPSSLYTFIEHPVGESDSITVLGMVASHVIRNTIVLGLDNTISQVY